MLLAVQLPTLQLALARPGGVAARVERGLLPDSLLSDAVMASTVGYSGGWGGSHISLDFKGPLSLSFAAAAGSPRRSGVASRAGRWQHRHRMGAAGWPPTHAKQLRHII